MNRPDFITFTGVDDATKPEDLILLDDDYPGRIEWGVLFSPKRQGRDPRYPSYSTIGWLATELELRWAAHLCGGDAREVIERGWSSHGPLLKFAFIRAQINTSDPDADPARVKAWADTLPLRAILQCRSGFPAVADVDILFDASGGRGIVPSDWPVAVPTTFCGYAGGLGPENVAQAVEVIGTRAPRYWIDMESGVRDECDRFSVAKCRAVCEAVYGSPSDQLPPVTRTEIVVPTSGAAQ